SMRVMLALLPLALARDTKRVIAPAQLEKITGEITPQLPLLNDPKEDAGMLRWLVEAQIAARQFEAARAILPILERLALALIPRADSINDFTPVVETAKLWRQSGDAAHAQALLKTIYEAPGAVKVSKRSRAHSFMWNGFLEEGRARLAALPVTSQDTRHSPSLAYYEAKYHPNVFPEWIAQIKAPRRRMAALIDFARALSEPIFESPEERELVLVYSGEVSFN
ncbi:MAG TPA: hypothetical protein VNA16_04995, partial [Abditibacteriaceae bacterium]|nr:hypothetical protein [Abditibacteriaceae bacterium]